MAIDVLFVTENDGEVLAVFPEHGKERHDWRLTYGHRGQHSHAETARLRWTMPAWPEQYAGLLGELRGIYANEPLRVIGRDRAHDWTTEDTKPLAGGDIGGDAQAGEAWSVRFRITHPEATGAVLTVNYYAVDMLERDETTPEHERWKVECLCMYDLFKRASDMDDTDRACHQDIRYPAVADPHAADGEHADWWARRMAWQALSRIRAELVWDGRHATEFLIEYYDGDTRFVA